MGKLIAFVGAPGSKKDYLAAKLYVYAVESGIPAALSLGASRSPEDDQLDFLAHQTFAEAGYATDKTDDLVILSSCWINHVPYVDKEDLDIENEVKWEIALPYSALFFLSTTNPTPENLKTQKLLEDFLLLPAFKDLRIVSLAGLSPERQLQEMKATINKVFLGESAL